MTEADGYEAIVASLTKEGQDKTLRVTIDDKWIYVTPVGTGLLEQGWKLHISSTVRDSVDILRITIPFLVHQQCKFKIIRTHDLLRQLNHGIFGMSQIGKFITIYPQNDEMAVHIAEKIDQYIDDYIGPSVPSDLPLHDKSNVFYRYGSFSNKVLQLLNGETVHALSSPSGALIPDQRRLFYVPPVGVSNPFPPQNIPASGVRLLGDRYIILANASRTARGWVLLAHDVDANRPCAIKQAMIRPQVGLHDLEPSDMLRREFATLQELVELEIFPHPLDLFEDTKCVNLVMDYIDGFTLPEYLADRRARSGPKVVEGDVNLARRIGIHLETLHKNGMVFRDLKSSNIIIQSDLTVRFVDAEHVYRQSESIPGGVGTRGYMIPTNSIDVAPKRADIYSYGCVLYYIVTGAEPSQAPDVENLLSRPIQDLVPDCPSQLVTLVEDCLNLDGEPDLDIAEILTRLSTAPERDKCLAKRSLHSNTVFSNPNEVAIAIGRQLISAFHGVRLDQGTWKTTHPVSANPFARDIDAGASGTVLALARFLDCKSSDVTFRQRILAVLDGAANWLSSTHYHLENKLPGLYFGEMGVALAVATAAEALSDNSLAVRAEEISQFVARCPHTSPDLFCGSAGRLRGHTLLSRRLDSDLELNNAKSCADFLIELFESRSCSFEGWRIPPGFEGLSDKVYLGYAHGAAGIADAFLDLFDCCQDDRYLSLAKAVGDNLVARAQHWTSGGPGVYWDCTDSAGDAAMPYWCHGATGIALFLMRLNARAHDIRREDILREALVAVSRGGRWARPTYCHGLSSAIDVLVEASIVLRDAEYHSQARELYELLASFVVPSDDGVVVSTENAEIVTPDLMVGYSGLVTPLLRLADPTIDLAIGQIRRLC